MSSTSFAKDGPGSSRGLAPRSKSFLSPSYLALFSGAIILLLVASCLLPHDRYLRFNSLHDAALAKLGWIYARIHFDREPIDIAFFGTSPSVFGVDSVEVERSYTESTGRPIHVVNFAMVHAGRNMHWLLARELLQQRKPRLLVIEIQEEESRALHPAFARVADTDDVLSAPLVINTSYLADLVQLPSRQISLFSGTIAPRLFGNDAVFDAARYPGAHWDDTYVSKGVANAAPHLTRVPAAELERQRKQFEARRKNRIALPPPFNAIEYRANLFYLSKLLDMAHAMNVPVRFMYIPGYHGAAAPDFDAFYKSRAPLWTMPREIVDRADLWIDVNHSNYPGAMELSQWLGRKLGEDVSLSGGNENSNPVVHASMLLRYDYCVGFGPEDLIGNLVLDDNWVIAT